MTLAKDYRMYYTLDDVDKAKTVISAMKEDCTNIKEYAETAIREAIRDEYGYVKEVLKAEAHTAKNGRLNDKWDYMADGAGNFDVWIDFVAELTDGFIKGGAYLSDIWNSPTEFRQHMYYRIFTAE